MARFGPLTEKIAAHGSLYYIAAQRRGGLLADPEVWFRNNPSPVPFLLDEDRSVTRAYGVYVRMNHESFDIARPATFVLDRSGIIRYLFVGDGQTDRAPLEKVLEALQAAP